MMNLRGKVLGGFRILQPKGPQRRIPRKKAQAHKEGFLKVPVSVTEEERSRGEFRGKFGVA